MGLIYLDSCLVIYLVENRPRWGESITRAIARAGRRALASRRWSNANAWSGR